MTDLQKEMIHRINSRTDDESIIIATFIQQQAASIVAAHWRIAELETENESLREEINTMGRID